MVEKELKFRMLGAVCRAVRFFPPVTAAAFRECGVSQEFLSFLDDALSSWRDTSRQRRAVVETV